jgi:hypothetical protein
MLILTLAARQIFRALRHTWHVLKHIDLNDLR